MKICAVTVTYGNRAALCIQISEQVLTLGVHQLIIVNNGSVPQSTEKLTGFSGQHSSVHLINLEMNTGSAKGFGMGITAFLASDCDYILLLDDDNLPAPDTLVNMIRAWNEIEDRDRESSIALAGFRKDRPNMIAALRTGDSKYILPARNSFMGFHIRLAWQFIRQRLNRRQTAAGSVRQSMDINASTYGGLWMHRRLCSRIGLPDTDYVLYMDDFEYTKRISDLPGRIILLRDCIIQDIEKSYYLPARKKWLYHSLLYASTDSITYYTCRNIVFFCRKNLVTNLFVYQVNRLLYFIAVFILSILGNKTGKLKIIHQAVKDAELPSMGRKDRFPL